MALEEGQQLFHHGMQTLSQVPANILQCRVLFTKLVKYCKPYCKNNHAVNLYVENNTK